MEIFLKFILGILAWICLFFVKKLLYKFLLAVIQLVARQVDYIGNKMEKVVLPIYTFGFPRILLNFLLICFSVSLLITEFSSLNTSMTYYFKRAKLDLFPTFPISYALSASYIAITLILGIIGLELVGFRQVLLDLLYESKGRAFSDKWQGLWEELKKPLNFFRVLIGVLLLLSLLYFAHLQGNMSIEREIIATSVKKAKSTIPPELFHKLLYALGFFIPILSAITFMSLEIFVATIAKILLMLFMVTQKFLAIGYDISKRSIEFIISPIELITTEINLATQGKYSTFLQPLPVQTVTGDLNEVLIFRNYNKGNSTVDNLAKHLTGKLEGKLEDCIDDGIDNLF
jgi:hypothetical protein